MFGEADPAVVPQAIPVEVGGVVERVPLAVMSVTAAITDLLEEAPHRDEGVTQGLSQLVEHPAFAAVEQFFQALGGSGRKRHRLMREYQYNGQIFDTLSSVGRLSTPPMPGQARSKTLSSSLGHKRLR